MPDQVFEIGHVNPDEIVTNLDCWRIKLSQF
jgi:hypothetical protein